MDAIKTGAYLASLRKSRGMTQQDAAEVLHLSNKTISKWESGGGFPEITVLPALAELYGVTADDILAGATLTRETAAFAVQRTAERKKYLLGRAEFRFKISVGVSAICALAGLFYRGTLFPAEILLLCSLLTIWVGWQMADTSLRGTGADSPAVYRRWFRLLLPVTVLQLWLVLWLSWWCGLFHLLMDLTGGKLQLALSRDLTLAGMLLLLPVLCLVLQLCLRRKAGRGAALIEKPYAVILLAGWAAFLAVTALRYTETMPYLENLARVMNDLERTVAREHLTAASLPFLRAQRGVWCGTAAALAAAFGVRRKHGRTAADTCGK